MTAAMARLILFNKPFGVLSQFTDTGNADSPRATLSDYIDLPGVYPAGRLDRDSEGLLLLTDDGRLQARIAQPRHRTEKTYLVQVEGLPDAAALDALRAGRHPEGRPHAPRPRPAHRPAGPVAARPAGAVPQIGARLLAGGRHLRRAQPAGPAHDSACRPPHPAAGALARGRLVA